MTNHYLHYSQCSDVAYSAKPDDDELDDLPVLLDPCVDTDSDSDGDAEAPYDFVANYPANDVDAGAGPVDPVVPPLVPGTFGIVPGIALQAGVADTVSEHVELSLLKLTNDANVPHYPYKEILEWSVQTNKRGYDFAPENDRRV